MTREHLTALIARVAQRDSEAFEKLYDASSAKLFGIIVRILHREHVSEEVLQDVFVTIWNRASSFDPSLASPITWMATIARNRAIDEARRKAPVATDPEQLTKMSDLVSALYTAGNNDDLIMLRQCLDALDQERRDMVLLAYFEGYSRETIAVKFACPVNTVKTRLRRSLLQLRECLS